MRPTADVRELFARALELAPGERARFLERASSTDAGLRAEVEDLLRHAEEAPQFLARPAVLDALPPEAAQPARIGPYAIESVLGEGGMGVVYLARQDSPRRQVALKVLRAGTLTPRALKRFAQEAEVLGRLQHPGIAQIHEAGTAETEAGPQPFFAMEYVRGLPLIEHCERSGLGARERLGLLAEVCDAVQHAHQKGVVHRDLKPGNVLVDTGAGRAQPKVLDFGVARATDPELRTASMLTGVGQLVGTVPYMSPEQAAGERERIDARTDVYALGVLAYELLTGRLPHDVRDKPLIEALRTIREQDPTPISAVRPVLRGDVETIVGKALEKDPARRYASVAELADDIRRWIRDEPVRARPPSALYQLGKFTRRHRALVLGAAGVFVALGLGLVGTAWQAHVAGEERDSAKAGWKAAEDARVEALQALDRTQRVSTWFQELFARAAPGEDGPDVKLTDVLDSAVREMSTTLAGAPQVESNVRVTVGRTYETIGRLAEAEEQLRAGLALLEGRGSELDVADVRARLASVLLARDRVDEAEELQAAAAPVLLASPSCDDVRRAELAATGALIAQRLGRGESAAQSMEAALAALRASTGPRSVEVMRLECTYGMVLSETGQLAESERVLEDALARARPTLGDGHPVTVNLINNLACTLQKRGGIERAVPLFEEALELGARVQGEAHPEHLTRMNNLAGILDHLGRRTEAEELYRRAIPLLHDVLGPDHPNTLMAEGNLATLLGRLKQYDEAARIHRDAWERMKRALGETDVRTLNAAFNLSWTVGQLRDFDEALRLNLEVVRLADEALGDDVWERWVYHGVLGSLLEALDRCAEAIPHLSDAAANLERILGPDHVSTQGARGTLERCREKSGR